MATVRRLGPDDWQTLREIRLSALADSPDAFGSTLERERAFGEDDWRRRASGPVVVVDDPGPVSMGGTFLADDDVLHLWGMWTHPEHRGRGHAHAVLDALVPADREVRLDVNVANPGARAVYERYGFVRTGRLQPLRPGSDQQIEQMVLRRG
jgi:ribosomal protein S18 acetylase RimI-like enzyme